MILPDVDLGSENTNFRKISAENVGNPCFLPYHLLTRNQWLVKKDIFSAEVDLPNTVLNMKCFQLKPPESPRDLGWAAEVDMLTLTADFSRVSPKPRNL